MFFICLYLSFTKGNYPYSIVWRWPYIVYFLLLSFFISCSRYQQQKQSPSSRKRDSIAIRNALSPPPPLSPRESLDHFKLQKGLTIKLVAAEPLVHSPVAIKFDGKGCLWVVEMTGFMPDTAGTGEYTRPAGKIVILEDYDHDGMMDHRKVFLDSLVLPRAIGFYGDGVLVGAPPKLWFVENDHDSAGAKSVVDSNYTTRSNVEVQPNGLLRGMDNWIYNAWFSKRYRNINGKWVSQHTHSRGQWGLTQDKYGRLFYNYNPVNLIGDYFLPSLGAGNPDQKHVSGFIETIVPDKRVYPIHPTPGVNRGYRPGVLDNSLRLTHFTAACGPVIYQGGALGPEYEGNAFVAEPAGNLVKRDILWNDGYRVHGKQAYRGREFLASDDERFRPVQLRNGPQGALYVVDMYRGILQDVTSLSSYLKKEIVKRNLQDPKNWGRIYKIVPQGKPLAHPDLSQKSSDELVDRLDDPNGWVRKTAQRLLTDGNKVDAEGQLRHKIKNDSFLVGKIHAFWTLEGLGKLQKRDILVFLRSGQLKLQQQAIAAAVSRMNKDNADEWIKKGNTLMTKTDKQLAPYIGSLAASAAQYAPQQANDLLLKLALQYKHNPYVSDAVISGLSGREEKFLRRFQQVDSDTSLAFYHQLEDVIANAKKRKTKLKEKKLNKKFARGKQGFITYCQTCHGADGRGIRSLGPPLDGSNWVTGDKQTLLAIVLFGLTGPIKVGDKLYKQPEVAGLMPGFGQNIQLSDKDVARITTFIRNAWTNEADAVVPADVKQARKTHKERKQPFTVEQLK